MSRTPTPQQASCVNALVETNDLVKIEACAGSGKTSTLTMMADAVRVPSIYLAFNKVTADEGAQKFPKHVTCKTTHSVAYAAHGSKLARADKLSRPKGRYVNVAGTGSEVARFYAIDGIDIDKDTSLSAAFLGLLTKQTVARFEQSADNDITERHVPHSDLELKLGKKDDSSMSFVKRRVTSYARKLWADRIDTRSPVLASHDTYLKMYQLSKPQLAGYDVVYVDEFQDTTPCVLDIIMNQRGQRKVVMVGDARQAIYGWRGAVNAMLMVDCEPRYLTKSFRYGQAVADVATAVLEGAMLITGNETISSRVGAVDMIDESKPHTRLFRTNAALLEAAVAALREGREIAIEIDTKDFVKLLESAVCLFNGDVKGVKHDKIIPHQNWDEAMEEAKHDSELGRITKAVMENRAAEWIEILGCFVSSRNPHITFTTAHKSKGREWSQVRVEGDFKSGFDEDGKWVGLVTEEQNLLYVACTRAIDVLEYNAVAGEYVRRRNLRRGSNGVNEWKEAA